ncbi:MAG: hypothetical protein ACOX08_00275 [Methanobacterium sp.]
MAIWKSNFFVPSFRFGSNGANCGSSKSKLAGWPGAGASGRKHKMGVGVMD